MKSILLVLAAVVLSVLGSFVAVPNAQSSLPSVTVAHPDQGSRFRILAEDGVLQPDGRTPVMGTKVWTVADTRTGQCYVLFLVATSTAVTGPIPCPQ